MMSLRNELHALEASTFEIEPLFETNHSMAGLVVVEPSEELAAATSSSCSCSSCCSCSTSSCCSCSTSCSSCG